MEKKLAHDMSSQKIAVTGGGSGGHTVTALAVIEELIARDESIIDRIIFIGGGKGMEGEKLVVSLEERMAEERGMPFVKIRSGKLQRSFSVRSLLGLAGVIGGLIDSVSIFKREDIGLVFSSGGYVTVPVCFVAWLKRVPVVIHEQTACVGLANKIASWFAKKILVGFPDSARYFPEKKVVVVGNTVRKALLYERQWPRSTVAKLRKFKARSEQYPVVLIAGGGQGSHLLNSIVMVAMKSLISHFHLILITGDNKVNRDYDRLVAESKKLSSEQRSRLIITKYASAGELGAYFHGTDVFVGRSGALFVYELGALGIPSVLIPIPWVTHNEQFHNARVLEEIGLANIVSEGVLSPEILFQEVQRMVTRIRGGLLRVDEKRRAKLFGIDAAKKIVDELERLDVL